MMTKLPSKLYHYCSVESMFNIIKSKSLWLSNSKQMNDSKESKWIEQYFYLIKNTYSDTKYGSFINNTLNTYRSNKPNPYLFCLSEDHDSLSQWRAYSNNATGVSIGFAPKQLNVKHQWPWENENFDYNISILKVEYSKKSQEETILRLAEKYKNDIKINKKFKAFSESTEFALELTDLSMIFKNSSFEEEKEWRIIHTPIDAIFSNQTIKYPDLSELKFRTTDQNIKTYYELSLNSIFNSSLIPEIILGPKSQIDIPELIMFLKTNGLNNTKIVESKSTYR